MTRRHPRAYPPNIRSRLKDRSPKLRQSDFVDVNSPLSTGCKPTAQLCGLVDTVPRQRVCSPPWLLSLVMSRTLKPVYFGGCSILDRTVGLPLSQISAKIKTRKSVNAIWNASLHPRLSTPDTCAKFKIKKYFGLGFF